VILIRSIWQSKVHHFVGIYSCPEISQVEIDPYDLWNQVKSYKFLLIETCFWIISFCLQTRKLQPFPSFYFAEQSTTSLGKKKFFKKSCLTFPSPHSNGLTKYTWCNFKHCFHLVSHTTTTRRKKKEEDQF